MNTIKFLLFLFPVFSQASVEVLSLSQALKEAYENSPRLQKSKSAMQEASWKRIESYSGYLPSFSASGSYLTGKNYALTDFQLPGSPVVSSIPQIIPTSSVTLTGQLPIFDGFASTHRYLSAKAFENSAEKDFEWTKTEIEREITLQYFRSLGAKILKDVAEQNLKTLEDHLRDVRLFKKAGMSTNYDVLRVEVQVSEAQSELLNAVDNVDINRNKLGELLGRESENREATGQLPVLSPDVIKKIDIQTVTSRKDILSLQDKVEGLDNLEFAAGTYWVPRINFFGQYQYYNNRTDDINDRANYRDAYNVGISLTWNIFDGMVSIARSKQSLEQRYQMEKSMRMVRIQAKQDIELWKRKYLYFCSVYRSRLNDVEKSAESVRLAREGRKVGARTNSDLLDAESELYRAKAGVVNSQLGAVEALIRLELATGQSLYSFE